MKDYITLLGTEQIQTAANRMQQAADDMLRAADIIANALEQHRIAMNEFTERQK